MSYEFSSPSNATIGPDTPWIEVSPVRSRQRAQLEAARSAQQVEQVLFDSARLAEHEDVGTLAQVMAEYHVGHRLSTDDLLVIGCYHRALASAGDPHQFSHLSTVARVLKLEAAGVQEYSHPAKERVLRAVSTLRAAASAPDSHLEAAAEAMTEAHDLPNLRRLLATAEQAGHRSARFARTRAAGQLRSGALRGWTTDLLEGCEPFDAAANNAAARDAYETGNAVLALPHALTAMAQRLDEYSGKTTARTCRLLGHPDFARLDNDCWVHIGRALEGTALDMLDSGARRRAEAAAAKIFASFGLDYARERALQEAGSQLLVLPRKLPSTIADGPASMVIDPLANDI